MSETVQTERVEEERARKSADVHRLFHSLWTKAVGTRDYDKEQWNALIMALSKLGVSV